MRGKFPLVVLFMLFASSAFAANTPVPAYTFICNGNASRMGPCPQGGRPNSLIQGSDGNFYGAAQVTMEAGTSSQGGVVFSLTPAGKLTVLHRFTPGPNKNYADGNFPTLLTEGPDGKLYGYTTFGGIDGVNGCDFLCGYGVIYRVDRSGAGFQIIYQFCSDGCSGDYRETASALVTAKDGNLYGTIVNGSSNGSIFRITPSTGAYEVVFNFSFPGGYGYASALTVAPDGTFYTMSLGANPALLLHYTPATGALTTTDVSFPAFDDDLPSSNVSGLTFGPNGNLYGLYEVYAEEGTGLFEIKPDGTNLQLFPFYINTVSAGPDGLILASDGNFWMANYYGTDIYGNIISISPASGALLQTFATFSETAAVGTFPAALIQAKDGTLWGSTYEYGDASTGHFADGTVFSLKAGLPPR
jgi:uncharacterized repeat protein (TIGR03803 family)